MRTRQTSRQAYAESIPNVQRLQKLILGHVTRLSATGATCDEIEVALNLRHQTASARINELVEKKYLVDSGKVRKTRSGNNAIVWLSDYPKAGDPVQMRLIPDAGTPSDARSKRKRKRERWVIKVASWGTLYAIGTEAQAETWRGAKANWERSVATKRLATKEEILLQKFDDLGELLWDATKSRHRKRRENPAPERPPLKLEEKKTWIKGLFLVSPTGAVSVGGRMLSSELSKYQDRQVKVSLEVLD